MLYMDEESTIQNQAIEGGTNHTSTTIEEQFSNPTPNHNEVETPEVEATNNTPIDIEINDGVSHVDFDFAKAEYVEDDFPNGDIAPHLALDRPDITLEEIEEEDPIPDGFYYLRGGLGFNLQLNGDLAPENPETLVPVQITSASNENGLIESADAYDQTKFAEGARIARLGRYQAPLNLGTLKELLQENMEEKPKAPADINITPEDLQTQD